MRNPDIELSNGSIFGTGPDQRGFIRDCGNPFGAIVVTSVYAQRWNGGHVDGCGEMAMAASPRIVCGGGGRGYWWIRRLGVGLDVEDPDRRICRARGHKVVIRLRQKPH